MVLWLFLSLEKRKETTIGVFTRCEALTCRICSVSEKSPVGTDSHWHPSSSGLCLRGHKLSWDNSHAKTWVSPFTPLAVFPKCSIAVQLPQKGKTFKRDGFALKSKIPAAQDVAVSASCLLATVRAVVAKAAQPLSGCKGRDPRLILLSLADELSRSSWRERCLICQTSSNT